MAELTHPFEQAAAVDHTPEVEQRLRRLEAAVAALSDTQLMEERVADRVSQRMKRAAPLKSLPDSAGVIVEAGRMLMPKPADVPPPGAGTVPPPDRPAWLLLELWGEVRTFAAMLFDHRYPFSFTGRFGPLCLAMAYLVSWVFISGILLIGPFLDRAFDV